MVPTKPGDAAPVRCSRCGKRHDLTAPARGRWGQVNCCGFTTTLYWSAGELRADGYCDPVIS